MSIRDNVFADILAERERQELKWGEQNHPNGTGTPRDISQSHWVRNLCDKAFKEGNGNWALILAEEFWEAMAESDPACLREELIQVAAVVVNWVECLDRNSGGES